MVPVTLDFRASQASGSGLGRMLAALGALAMIACGLAFAWLLKTQFDLENTVRSQKVELRRLQESGQAAAAIDPDGEVARRLTRPWQALLLAIESVATPRIALLEIRPDPGQRQVRLTGEAANLEEALDYLRQLQKLPVLSRPHLLSYGVVNNPGAPPALRFVIQSEWVGA